MTAPDERFSRSRALRERLSRRPQLTDPPPTLPESRTPADDRTHHAPAWFTYTAAGDRIDWSDELGTMLGRPHADNEVSRQVLARYVHRDDHARALGAITQTWTGREPVRTTVRLMRADGPETGPGRGRARPPARLRRAGGAWFGGGARWDPRAGPEGRGRGVHGTVHAVPAREGARREVTRLARRGESVQPSIIERDP